jgi:signal transduction histidine kinase
MDVIDDGLGIDPQDVYKAGALGLLGIRERFAALGGALVMQRREPRGTSFIVSLPIPPAANGHAV